MDGGGHGIVSDNDPGRNRGARRGQGRGRGRGRGAARGSRDASQGHSKNSADSADSASHPAARHITSGATTSRAPGLAPQKKTAAASVDEEEESEVCFICASPVIHNGLYPCGHLTCHICALRMRALYKTNACPHCRTTAELVVFTDSPEKRFNEFEDADYFMKDSNLGINYEKQEIFEDTVLLLRYNCPDAGCDVACLGWPDLHRHVKSVHGKQMCDLCTRNKKVFTHEHELFSPGELRKHERFGDDNPGAEDQTGFKGHPECGFCRQRFYGDDELYVHCRDRHESCFVCSRTNRNPQYYLDYHALELHFRKDHFPCPDQECMEKKFVVFGSEMDLKAHQLESHPNGITKGRDARKVDMSGFDYRQTHQQERPRREGRGRGRGRDPNAEPLPASSAQPLRRDEVAFQRQMAIQSAQSVTSRTFGGTLTAAEAPRPAQSRDPQPDTVTVNRPSHPDLPRNLEALTLDDAPLASLSPQEQAKRLRHASVVERASILLKNDASKLADFRTKVSAYQSGTVTASALIDSFFSIFDPSSQELGKLVKELADVLENPAKRDNLLKAWSDWRAINEDYPTLPGPGAPSASSSTPVNSWAASVGSQAHTNPLAGLNVASGNRVLRLKSSTARSNRSASTRSAASGNPFPPLSSTISTTLNARSRPSVPGWLNAASSSSSSPAVSSKIITSAPATSVRAAGPASQVGPSSSSSGGGGSQRAPGRDMFPALPAAQKLTSTVFSPGYTGSGVKRVNNGAAGGPGNAWGVGFGAAAATTTATATSTAQQNGTPADGDEDGVVKAKGKGKKGKKQILYNWG